MRQSQYLMYVGTYTGDGSEGIYAYRFDLATGETRAIGLAAATDNPSFLAVDPDRRFLYAANELDAFQDEPTGAVSVFAIDQLLVHRFDAETGSLTPGGPAFVAVDPGAGPRQVAFAPSGKFVYLVNELASTITVFAYEQGPGTLSRLQTILTLPEGFAGTNTSAEIEVASKGRFVYVSNRGHDSIAVFSVDPSDGCLTSLEWVPSGGRTPRHFAIDPTGRWLFAANQGSNNVSLFRIDQESGRLTPADRSLAVVAPVCVRIVSFD